MAILTLYIQPGAHQTRLVGLHNGMLKIQLKAKAIDGEANTALIAFLAERCGIPKSSVQITAGHKSRIKRVSIPDSAIRLIDLRPIDEATHPRR